MKIDFKLKSTEIGGLALSLGLVGHDYTLCSKKEGTNLTAITPSNLNRFSKFFHWQIQQ